MKWADKWELKFNKKCKCQTIACSKISVYVYDFTVTRQMRTASRGEPENACMHVCNLYGHVGSIQETYATMCGDVVSYGG